MVRETSIEAYHTIKENGLLSRCRMWVYETLFEIGPVTASQLAEHTPEERNSIATGARNVHARLNELRQMGVVKELGETKCPISGMMVILWDVTAKLPIKLEKQVKPTRKEIRKKTLELLDSAQDALKNLHLDDAERHIVTAKEVISSL